MAITQRRIVLLVGVTAGLLACPQLPARGADTAGASKARDTKAKVVPVAGPKHVDELAKRIFAITEVVLDHHIQPPTRQEMILVGLQSACAVKKVSVPDLGRRVSDVRTLDELSNLLRDVWPKIAIHDDQASNAQVEEALYEGMLRAVPGKPDILPAKEARVRAQIQANRYVGIGIALTIDEEKTHLPQIKHAMPGGPAALGGVKDGDLIERINNKPIASDTKLTEVVDRLRGPEGSELTIRVRHPGAKESRTLPLVRLPVMFKSVKNTLMGDGDDRVILASQKPPIAYLKIESITASTARELADWEPRLREAGVKGLILDLRGVGAGEGFDGYHSAVLLADSLLDGKPIGKLRTREGVRAFTADRECLFRDLPLAILIHKHTDGPAAWVAAALQDADPPGANRRRAVIVGTPGGGDNFVRSAVSLPDGDQLVLPTGLWERPRTTKEGKRTFRFLSFTGDAAVSDNWSATQTQVAYRLDGVMPDAVFTMDEKPAALEAIEFNATGQAALTQAYTGNAANKQATKPQDGGRTLSEQAAVRELERQIELAAKAK